MGQVDEGALAPKPAAVGAPGREAMIFAAVISEGRPESPGAKSRGYFLDAFTKTLYFNRLPAPGGAAQTFYFNSGRDIRDWVRDRNLAAP